MKIIFALFVILLISTSSSLPRHNISRNEVSSRIVNGQLVNIKQIPYQASIKRRTSTNWAHICGASVISEKRILSAAHCVADYISQPPLIRVVVGTSSRLSGGKSYDVSKIIVHETYSPISLRGDIALLVTNSKISFDSNTQAIAFAPQRFYLPAGMEALVSGFGTTSFGGDASNSLLAAIVQIIDQSLCSQAYRNISAIYPEMICAGGSNPPRDACQGDSGGPLVAHNVQIGIVSWGEGCAHVSYPGIYTGVSSYSQWIHLNL